MGVVVLLTNLLDNRGRSRLPVGATEYARGWDCKWIPIQSNPVDTGIEGSFTLPAVRRALATAGDPWLPGRSPGDSSSVNPHSLGLVHGLTGIGLAQKLIIGSESRELVCEAANVSVVEFFFFFFWPMPVFLCCVLGFATPSRGLPVNR